MRVQYVCVCRAVPVPVPVQMQEVLDPSVGQDVVAEMSREIHRMQLRHSELLRLQERLMAELERALSKRELIALKGKATQARAASEKPKGSSAGAGTITRSQLDKALVEMQRSVRDTEREVR